MESFKCEECNVEFKEQENLNSHKANVHLMKKHHCETCKKDFASNASLKSHKKFVHKENLTEDLKCDICNKTLSRKDHLRTHKKNVHKVQNTNSEDLKCDVCNKTFSRKDHLKNHKSAVHEKILNHACKSCDKKFAYYLQLYNHIRDEHNKDKDKSNPAEIESGTMVENDNIAEEDKNQENIKSLEEPKPIKIEKEEDTTEESLSINNTGGTLEQNANKTENKNSEKPIENEKKNSNTNQKSSQYSCQICNKIYSKRVHLKRHNVANHPNKQTKFIKNEKVGLEFDATKQNPDEPMQEHCDKMFSTSEDLCNHIRIDHKVPEYKGIGSFVATNYICKLEAHGVEI